MYRHIVIVVCSDNRVFEEFTNIVYVFICEPQLLNIGSDPGDSSDVRNIYREFVFFIVLHLSIHACRPGKGHLDPETGAMSLT